MKNETDSIYMDHNGESSALFAVCSPLQLIAALCVRFRSEIATTYSSFSLMISPKFRGYEKLLESKELSNYFDSIVLYDPFKGNYFPQVMDWFRYTINRDSKSRAFEDSWSGYERYDTLLCGDPNLILDLRLFRSKSNDFASVILFDEGAGSYNGSISSMFCLDSGIRLNKIVGLGRRAIVKYIIKQLALRLGLSKEYFFTPVEAYFFSTHGPLNELYPKTDIHELEANSFERLLACCPELSCSSASLYRSVDAIYLGAWDEACPVSLQGQIVELIASKGLEVVCRPHPRSNLGALKTKALVDSSEDIWEMLCASDAINNEKLIFGFCSSAQETPVELFGKKPTLFLLHRLLPDGFHAKEGLVVAANRIIELYGFDGDRVFVPKNLEDLERMIDIVTKKATSDV